MHTSGIKPALRNASNASGARAILSFHPRVPNGFTANLVEICSIVIPRTGGHPLMNHNFVNNVPKKWMDR